MNEIRRLAHVERLAIRWGDMDAMGHVNNTVYFRYMEQARISWFDRLVPEDEAWQSTGIVIANATCNYRRAITYPGNVHFRKPAGELSAFYRALPPDKPALPESIPEVDIGELLKASDDN